MSLHLSVPDTVYPAVHGLGLFLRVSDTVHRLTCECEGRDKQEKVRRESRGGNTVRVRSGGRRRLSEDNFYHWFNGGLFGESSQL